jgi:cytoskeletal protein RodZ
MDVGQELRQARLTRGLTLGQVSAATRVTYERLEAIERNKVLGMPLVYVRGYIREFAREVGLDPDDVTERYIAQFETTTAAPAFTQPFDREIAQPSDAGTTRDNSHDRDDLARPHDGEAPRRTVSGPRTAQWAVLVLVAIVATQLGFMVGWTGARYGLPGADDARSIAASVDAERRSAPTQSDPDAVPASAVAPITSTATAATDLSGGWTMTNEVQASELRTFRGLRLVYEIELLQDGANVSGTGHKLSENGRALRGAARTPITLSGTVDGSRVHLTFREKGQRRESGGSFQFRLADDGSLQGTFESDAAKSSGQSILRRALP